MKRFQKFLIGFFVPLLSQHYIVWCFKGNFEPDKWYGVSAVLAVFLMFAFAFAMFMLNGISKHMEL